MRYNFFIMFQSTPDLINRENLSQVKRALFDLVSIHSRFN